MNTRIAVGLWLAAILLLGGLAPFDNEGLGIGLLVAVPVALICGGVCRSLDRNLNVRLVVIFFVALTARWVVAATLQTFLLKEEPGMFAPDELQYKFLGDLYARYLSGTAPDLEMGPWKRGIVYFIAACDYAFGFHAWVPRLLICTMGAWCAVLTAMIAAQRFSQAVAFRAGMLAALFPSLVLWSTLLIKDTPTLLCALIALYSFLRMRRAFHVGALVCFALALLWMSTDRPYEVAYVGMAVAASLLIGGSRQLFRNSVLLLLFSVVFFLVLQRTSEEQYGLSGETPIIDRIATVRASMSTGANSAVDVELVDTRSFGGLLLWVPIGLVYFFLAPIPFSGRSAISLATSPEMLLFYSLLPSMWRALRAELKRRNPVFMTLFFYMTISSIGWSIAITNVGTIYRHRGQILFVPLILIASDQIRRRELRRQRQPLPVRTAGDARMDVPISVGAN